MRASTRGWSQTFYPKETNCKQLAPSAFKLFQKAYEGHADKRQETHGSPRMHVGHPKAEDFGAAIPTPVALFL